MSPGSRTAQAGAREPASAVVVEGYAHPSFRPLVTELERQLTRGGGASVCVYHRGSCVVDVWGGVRDAAGAPWSKDTMALSFSTTKGVLATLVQKLVDERRLDYDVPVARLWPEFAQAGKGAITVRQLLCHQAGLYAIRPLLESPEQMLDWQFMTSALAASAPRVAPGTRSAYHALTFGWLVGEVVQRATGAPLPELLRTHLAEPLAADGMYFGAPEAERPRTATLLAPARGAQPKDRRARLLRRVFQSAWGLLGGDPDRAKDALSPAGGDRVFYTTRALDGVMPAFNGVFTARSLARMYAMLAGGGVLEGRRHLGEATIRRATAIQSFRPDLVVGIPMLFRLGYHLVGTGRTILPRAFGHFGWGGSGAWADPARDLAVAMTLNRIAGTPFGDDRMLRLGGLAVRCAEAHGR